MSTSRRDEVLAALLDARGGFVSGEALASALGVTRVAIAKHVRHLREAGYEIPSVPGVGYRLAAWADALTIEAVASRVSASGVSQITGGVATGSTNDDARRLAAQGVPEVAVVVAPRQTAGRGRLGRTWESATGGVYLSFLFRPPLSVAELTSLPLVVGLGAAQGLERLGVSAGLKWPNDLVLDRGKLGGVLLEMAAEADRAQWVVAGIGLNVRSVSLPEGIDDAACLEDSIPSVELAEVAAAVIDGTVTAYAEFVTDGFESLRPEYDRRHVLVGRRVTVADSQGERVAAGRAEGVDDFGRLVVSTADGVTSVASGDVTLRRS